MTGVMKWILSAHIVAGVVALIISSIPLITKKGSKNHIRTGWIYSIAMIVVALSAFTITPWRFFFDPNRNPETLSFAVFLFFISMLTASALWFGFRVLKFKNRTMPSKDILHILPAVALIVCALLAMAFGVHHSNRLLTFFPILGLLSGYSQIKYWRSIPTEKMHWWFEHMTGMFTACIATVTAFTVTAVPRFVSIPNHLLIFLWLSPALILLPVRIAMEKNYRRKFKSV